MNPFAISPPGGPEWIVILLIVVLLFGAKKLPELGGSVGRSIKEFKKGIDEGRSADEEDPEQPASAHKGEPKSEQ